VATTPIAPVTNENTDSKKTKKRPARSNGIIGTNVVTRIVGEIPAWVAWSLAGLGLFASATAMFLVRERRRRRLAELDAMADSLTGIANRKAFERRLELEWKRAVRYGRSLGLLIVDVDGFKAVNDRHGHAAGDSVLRQLAERLEDRLRDTDLVARIGGDEFAVICPETGINELRTVCEQLRSHAIDGVDHAIGLSIGVAEWQPGDESPEQMIERADASMYTVKRASHQAAAAAAR
jgi:diguanylate cyclase (GGDEF)-like protein